MASSVEPSYKLFIWDTGTTGKDQAKDSIHALAAQEYTSSSSDIPESYFSLVLPSNLGDDIPKPEVAIPNFTQVWTGLCHFVKRVCPAGCTPLFVAHNCEFDASFLRAELDRARLSYPAWHFACTLRLVNDVSDTLLVDSLSQRGLAEHFGITVEREHHADDDARVLADILLSLEGNLSKQCGRNAIASLCKQALPLDLYTNVDQNVDSSISTEVFLANEDGNYASTTSVSAPSSNQHLTTSSPFSYIRTMTGKYYHKDPACKNLRSAKRKIPVPVVPSELRPCYICVSVTTFDQDNPSLPKNLASVSVPSESRINHGRIPETTATAYITTATGKFYHGDQDCYNLRSAKKKFSVSKPAEHLRACYLCLPDSDGPLPRAISTPASDESATGLNGAATVRATVESEAQFNALSFFTTRTGRLFHLDKDCYSLRSAQEKIEVQQPPSNLEACGRCVSDNAIRKSPKDDHVSETALNLQDAAVKYITTMTGRFYHQDAHCKNLRSARKKIPVCSPADSLQACYLCVTEPVTRSKLAVQAKRSPATNQTKTSTTETSLMYITTRTGRFYHENESCRNLRSARSKMRTASVSPTLRACYICVSTPCNYAEHAVGESNSVNIDENSGFKPSVKDGGNVVRSLKTELECSEMPTQARNTVQLAQSPKVEVVEGVVGEENENEVAEAAKKTVGISYQRRLRGKHERPSVDTFESPTKISDGMFDSEATIGHDVQELHVTGETGVSQAERTTKGTAKTVNQMTMKRETLEPYGNRFWKTRTGAKFHVDGCVYLRNKDAAEVFPEEEKLEPCRKCLGTLFMTWEVKRFNASVSVKS